MKKLVSLLVAGLMVGALIIGCGTENPWSPDPARPLELSFVAGPADTVAYGATITFSWKSKGGSGEVQYQYRLGAGSWSTPSSASSVTYTDVTAGNTFNVMATDAAQSTQEVSRQFWVESQPSADTTPPTVWIISSPIEDSYVATGSNVSFSWDGEDDVDMDNLLFWYSFAGATSETTATRTVTFANVQAADPATFSVWAMDQSGNASGVATVSFIIKDATILYVDDYQWLDLNGNVDMPKERQQKQFYRDALEGYAFAEWDIALQGMPDSSDLVVGGQPVYSTILFASDSDIGTTSGTWWSDVGAVGGGVLAYYMENGGRLIATGALFLVDVNQLYPPDSPHPMPGDFEYDWLGIDSFDWPWDFWQDFTWAIGTGNFAGLPDSMKIDVGKNGDQVDYSTDVFDLRDSSVVMFTKGLDIDGEEPYDYGSSVGHLFYISDVPRSACLTFDTFSMPLEGVRATFRVILTEFGE